MDEKIYKTKKEDYEDLYESFGVILEKFKDYDETNEKQKKELDVLISTAIENSADIPGSEKMFKLIKGYVVHRSREYREFWNRRQKAENTFFQALPEIMDSIVIPEENSCKKIADAVDTYAVEDNFSLLVKAMVSEICNL